MSMGRRFLIVAAIIVSGVIGYAAEPLFAPDGALGDVRRDVRLSPAPRSEADASPQPSSDDRSRSATGSNSDSSSSTDEVTGTLYGAAMVGAGIVVALPFWVRGRNLVESRSRIVRRRCALCVKAVESPQSLAFAEEQRWIASLQMNGLI